jgi:DNA-binding CsgD family transcriptional regulator
LGAAAVPLIGRGVETEAIERWLAGVAAGQAGRTLIEGEAGIGKTRLADAARAGALELSMAVFLARADELDRGRPFGVLTDALGFVPEILEGAVAVPGLEYRLVDQLVEWVERRALEGPVVVLLEDLQWADPGTVVALRALGRRLGHLPVGLLGTLRPWPRSPELEKLIRAWQADGMLHLALAPLDTAAVLELAAVLIGARAGPSLERQLASAAGNPLFVRELLGALEEDQAIALSDGVAELSRVSLPRSLRLTILRRVGMLGEGTVALLRTASLLGGAFSLADLGAVAGLDVRAVWDVLEGARNAGVIEDAGPDLRFRHDLVRDAIYTDLPESARRAMHREAGRALARSGAPTLQVAEQLALGASPGDRETIEWLRDAAQECVLRAPQTAVALLEQAAELAEPEDPTRDWLLADLADGLVWCGRPNEGQSSAADLLARGTPPPTRDRARATVVRGLWLDGRWRELITHTDHWLGPDAPPLTPAARAGLLSDAAMAAVFSGDVERADAMGAEALAIGEQLGDDAVVFRALQALGPVYNFRGRKDEELAASERALRIVERRANPDLVRFQPYFAHGMALAGQDRHREAEEAFRTGLRVREQLGTVWDLPLYQAGLADLHCQMGRWDDALAEADTGIAIADEVGTRLAIVVCAGVAARIRIHRDELADAERLLAIAQREIDRAGPSWGSYWVILATVELADARGDRQAALDAVERGWVQTEHSPGLRAYLAPALVRVALASEGTQLARSIADTVSTSAPGIPVPSASGSLLLCRGLADGDARLLTEAVEWFRTSGQSYELAVACEAAAAALAQAEQSSDARPLFEEALAIYEQLQARRDTARTLATMRRVGMRRGSRAAHRQALKGWDSLTAMETDVVRLTVEGLTNRQIGERLYISRRTVQTHLSHALTKLEVSSRVELAAAAAKHAAG